MEFAKATRKKAKARIAMFGPSGAGKTMSALRIASGMGKRIAVIDTERGSASKYAGHELIGIEYDALDLPARDIDTYVKAIGMAGKAGYDVLIIDSLTHAWQELLEEVEKIAQTKYRGNTWSAWSQGTPKQRTLIDAILDFPGHVIATMRSKTEWAAETGSNGKSAPKRIGLAPEQGKGIEYEFDILFEISVEHIATIIKDRSGRYQDKMISFPDQTFGKELAAWLDSGDAPTESTATLIKQLQTARANVRNAGFAAMLPAMTPESAAAMTVADLKAAIAETEAIGK